MPTFVQLIKFTQQGIQNIKQGPTRLDAAKRAYKEAGGKIVAFYLVTGRYDAVVVAEAPDDETVARISLGTGALGNIRTETLRAFTEDEYRGIVGKLK